MVDIDNLRKQRSYIKGKLTRIEQSVARPQEQATTTIDKEEAEVRLERLEQVINEFHTVQRQIISETDEPLVCDVTAEAEFEERSLAAKAILRRIIKSSRTENNETRTTESDSVLVQFLQKQMTMMEKYEVSGTAQAQASSVVRLEDNGPLGTLLQTQTELLQRLTDNSEDGVTSGNRVKLPTIKLPSFDGKIEEWTKFADVFKKTIHSNRVLPNIQKFIYLRSCVTGAAARAIEDIELSDDNYSVAWEQLQKRFEDSGAIKRKHVQCLFEIPLVEKESANAILQLVDHVNKHTRVLKRLGSPTDSWGDLLQYMVESKLDRITLRAWEERNSIKAAENEANEQESNFDVLMEFLIQRCHALERIDSSKTNSNVHQSSYKNQGQRSNVKGNQPKNNATDNVINKFNIYMLLIQNCKHGSCRECTGRHNTLLHRTKTQATTSTATTSVATEPTAMDESTRTTCYSSSTARHNVLMATAIVDAVNQKRFSFPIRVLLDSGSEANFITQNVCNKLGLKRNAASEIVAGVNNAECQVRQFTNVIIKSRHAKFQINTQCLVIPKITRDLPSKEIDKELLNIPSNLQLADFEFNKRSSIDLLIGAEFFFEILESGKIKLDNNKLVLQNTKFGWVVAGPIYRSACIDTKSTEIVNALHCTLIEDESLNDTLKQFWEIESCTDASKNTWSPEEVRCERLYQDTTTRDSQGRFVVSLPFKSSNMNIGETRSGALKRLYQIERRFKNDKVYHERYIHFMREYLDLQHMSLVDTCNIDNEKQIVYLPHHGVIKESSSTTKLRVVFDASHKGSSGNSLNDRLITGPILQDSLIQILLRFRFHNIAIIGNLEKMFRQILVRDCDRDYQRILWRFSTSEPVREYKLNTVTYGQAGASYLAIRSVRQLAEEGKDTFPLAADCISNDVYVDDIVSGARDVNEAKTLQNQLNELMNKGCFKIHKWHSNVPEIFRNTNNHENTASVDLKFNDNIKTLGLVWEPNTDVFVFTLNLFKEVRTKRELLSEISKLFDPLGLLGPIITFAKLLMQETWKEKIDWDSELPATLLNKWKRFKDELTNSTILRIPRKISSEYISNDLILYGFCDASQDAYGACIYVKVLVNNKQTIRLLCSKSRIAPIKTISIPRLELCSAVLLARLLEQVKQACKIEFRKIFAYTDSLTTLYWIKGDPSRWKTFVANRVSEITSILTAEAWAHVKSEDNPADLLSRGAFSNALQTCELWWQGPAWMSNDSASCQTQDAVANEHSIETNEIKTEERKPNSSCHHTIIQDCIYQRLYHRMSDLNKIERVLAYCLRFISRCKRISMKQAEALSVTEIEAARSYLIRNAQDKAFHEEILTLQQSKCVKSSSKLLTLHPFLDKDVLRVGGRLRHAPLSYNQRHPILLPSDHILTKLIIKREHERLLHSGPQALLAAVRRKYWPLRGRDAVRKIYHSCVWCTRKSPHASLQLGDLPVDRVTPMRPFFNCGIDFAGPIITLVNKGRGRKTNKSYIALFICFATKAIHLEAVTELSAQREINEVYRFLQGQVKGPVQHSLVTQGIQWNFIPPYSPHIGGLWEAGVKSCKNLLRTVLGNTSFTFEELHTALTQVEACLNSRPLYASSNDPADLEPLTPGHFLIGGPITYLPEADLKDINIHRLNRWQVVQRTFQDFWKRLATEYVSSLQGRTKWNRTQRNLEIGDLVIIREEHTPPYQWKLGRIAELHQGQDKLIRVVSVKTIRGVTKYPVNKLCKLPVNKEDKDYY
ncbi:PREDICTED: uncharacterized protein LOC108766798 [Trachymyrmex cornetzi]|uniref:uncharacterized protein LOC108766798 n=1 Tax=Trachymyrmex cornetzi TaxID=471704 RepID=UPI00084EFE79|nr:PREDICTED: uncharacterized protein LOC108766798 [Trachymyrmex cornetzi]